MSDDEHTVVDSQKRPEESKARQPEWMLDVSRTGRPSSPLREQTKGGQSQVKKPTQKSNEENWPPQNPNQPLPGEIDPQTQRWFRAVVLFIAAFGMGAALGTYLAPAGPKTLRAEILKLESALTKSRAELAELKRSAKYSQTRPSVPTGSLSAKDKKRHQAVGKNYAKNIKAQNAQAASEMVSRFVGRWNAVLDQPRTGDRTARRAEILEQLVGSMSSVLHPGDYVPWQDEFVSGRWLGDLHFDLDNDGFPKPRNGKNPKDSFNQKSVCHIAMALNQTISDAHVFLTPNLNCKHPKAKISAVLRGATLNDALNNFAVILEEAGFAVVETRERGQRYILIGPGRRVPTKKK